MTSNESRPAGNGTASMSLAGDHSIVAETDDNSCRCVRCRRVLTADRSVRLGIGPRCWELTLGVAA